MSYILSPDKRIDFEHIKRLMNGEVKSTCIPSMLIFGEPGAGKTAFGKHVAQELNAELIFAPCYDGINETNLIYNWDLGTLVDAMSTEEVRGRDALKDGFLLKALKISQHKRVVLLIDEIDKAKPSVDTFLLTYMQECLLNDPVTGPVRGKKENIFIVCTSNKNRQLEDALDRRFTFIREFHFPDEDELKHQLKTMITVKYDPCKIHVITKLAVFYRTLEVTKKPSQNQIADLIAELATQETLEKLPRRAKYLIKVKSLLWKFSQNVEDHKLFLNNLANQPLLRKIPDNKKLLYLGSMI